MDFVKKDKLSQYRQEMALMIFKGVYYKVCHFSGA